MRTRRSDIDDFLQQKRIAVVGVSRNAKDFSRGLFRELASRGYDVVPVNPGVNEVEGKRCFARVQEISPPATAALLMVSTKDIERVVHDCAEVGILRIWMYGTGGHRGVHREAVAFCQQHGITSVAGHCPYMFLPDTGLFPHRFHGAIVKLLGHYPVAS